MNLLEDLKWNKKLLRRDKTSIVKRAKKKRLLIVSDSHAKGMASEIHNNLVKDYVDQGIVKSGARYGSDPRF
jgi:hypothetical protein